METSELDIGSRLYFELDWMKSTKVGFPVQYYADNCKIMEVDGAKTFDLISDGCMSQMVQVRMHSEEPYSKSTLRYSSGICT